MLAGIACTGKPVWRDPSKHKLQFVTVQDGVRLEVLDWGGSGRPLVLLAGNGLSAHVYDGFAEKLAGPYHVYGITRRGMGASTHAESGYDENRLADDVLHVIDSLQLTKPVLVGHSKAGGEMTVLASQHPDRLGGLVYMDAARDVYDDSELLKRAEAAGWKRPQPSPAEVKSFSAYHDWQMRTLGYALPESELRSVFNTNPDGSMGPHKTAGCVFEQLFAGTFKKDYS
ncbi:MAG: alpha/beta hydrolase [Acidobacteriales bacterium]|nr:alpha/beta hydrolase [Terriglobales bacterium]